MSNAKKKETEEKAETPAVAEDRSVAIANAAAKGNWGAIEEMETTDLLVPKIYHQQALSKLVSEGKAKPGDFCDSLTGEVLASGKLGVIIFGSYKTLLRQKLESSSGRWKLQEIITVVPSNAAAIAELPFNEESNGEKFKNNLYYNFYCLLAERINELPFVLSMGSTKIRAAKKLNTMIYKLSCMKPSRPSAAVVFELVSVPEKNDRGNWMGLDIHQGRDVTTTELMKAFAWHAKSKTQSFVVVEEEAANQTEDDNIPF